ncbi:MAG: CDP-alcohol phosphatidyltransferase family protein [Hyphomicrobiales bacterium]|nr:CDP-alcohol phosphatidyltransferase family protein [Hyphomicrobiales bacterium]
MTIYKFKPHFQNALRPVVSFLAKHQVTANQVTIIAALGSIAVGTIIAINNDLRWLFLTIPVWFFIRMALNAIDGMLAREFNQKSKLGAYLNEISDVISDAVLYLPFAFLSPFNPMWVGGVIFLSTLSEFAGVLGTMVGSSRRYDGPMGKSDRAIVFSALALAVGLTTALPQWTAWIMPCLALLLCLTIFRRVHNGLRETQQ